MISLERVKRRKLVHWALAYLAGAWLTLQVLDLLAENFGWPVLVVQLATGLLAVGFVGALVLAWYHGERGEQRVSAVELGMLTALLVIAGAVVAFLGGGGRDDAAPPASVIAEQGSIAVLPFVNMSADPNQEYFSDGLTEELINVLAQIPALRVAARTSAFAFEGKDMSVAAIGRALHVAYVLEGSVRKAGERVRITAQLINVENGFHEWSQTYDRTLSDIFAVQDEISRAIVDALRLELMDEQAGAPLARVETGDPAAHALVLKGYHAWNERTRASLAEAAAFFEQAIALDPAYARAHAMLGWVTYYRAYSRHIPADAGYARAKAEAARALALDPILPTAHLVLGSVAERRDWDFPTAAEHYRRAVELNPGSADGHTKRAGLLSLLGRSAEAIAAARRAAELDPVSPNAYNALSTAYVYAREPERALEAIDSALLLLPDHAVLLCNRALNLSDLGRYAEAIRTAERARAQAPNEQSAVSAHAYVLARAGRRAEAEEALGVLENLPEPSPYSRAGVYAALGDRETAFALLELSVREHEDAAVDLGVDPVFDPLRGDPRMERLLVEIGLRGSPAGRVPTVLRQVPDLTS